MVAEDMDFQSLAPDPGLDVRTQTLLSRVMDAHLAILNTQHDVDPFYGRRVAADLSNAGLVDVQTEGRASMWRGGEPGGTLCMLTLAQMREAIVAAGEVTPSDVEEFIELCDGPRLSLLSPVTMAAWGRRPTDL